MTETLFMERALELAQKAYDLGEVPVGAVVAIDGTIVGEGYNLREKAKSSLRHAELDAIHEASQTLGSWRLLGATLYVTLEPCLMCAGAIYQARLSRVVYGARDPKAGALGSLYEIHNDTRLNHRFEAIGNVLAAESADLLKKFFKERRS